MLMSLNQKNVMLKKYDYKSYELAQAKWELMAFLT